MKLDGGVALMDRGGPRGPRSAAFLQVGQPP